MFSEVSLYVKHKYEKNKEDLCKIEELLDNGQIHEFFCTKCKKERSFRSISIHKKYDLNMSVDVGGIVRQNLFSTTSVVEEEQLKKRFNKFVEQSYWDVSFACQHGCGNVMKFFFKIDNDYITKVGQDPSLGELKSNYIIKYRKILNDRYAELNRAIMLHSHDVGIGSYAYLRRVFEMLIEDIHLEMKDNEQWDEELYSCSKMHEKIELLKDELPQFLVDNSKTLYSLLSKGIHELSEEDCLEHFDPTIYAIELILDQRLEDIKKKERNEQAKKLLNKSYSNINRNT